MEIERGNEETKISKKEIKEVLERKMKRQKEVRNVSKLKEEN
jgi:hypothetical protein